jgi:hypothetical protein
LDEQQEGCNGKMPGKGHGANFSLPEGMPHRMRLTSRAGSATNFWPAIKQIGRNPLKQTKLPPSQWEAAFPQRMQSIAVGVWVSCTASHFFAQRNPFHVCETSGLGDRIEDLDLVAHDFGYEE